MTRESESRLRTRDSVRDAMIRIGRAVDVSPEELGPMGATEYRDRRAARRAAGELGT